MDENSLEKLDNELHVKVNKCVKQKYPCVFYFPNQTGCPLLARKFCPKYSPGAQKNSKPLLDRIKRYKIDLAQLIVRYCFPF